MTVNAVIIGNIAGLVANLDTDSAAHNSKADALNAYMHHHHILHLQQRVVGCAMSGTCTTVGR